MESISGFRKHISLSNDQFLQQGGILLLSQTIPVRISDPLHLYFGLKSVGKRTQASLGALVSL